MGCVKLAIVTFARDSELRTIGEYALNRTAVETVTIPAKVTTIKSFAFANCLALTNVVFEVALGSEAVACDAFDDCPRFIWRSPDGFNIDTVNGVTDVVVPQDVERISVNGFKKVVLSLLQFSAGTRLKRIESCAFREAEIKSTVLLPTTVEFLGPRCFQNCKMVEFSFGDNLHLHDIPDFCFYHSSIRKITIPRSVQALGKSCFAGSDRSDRSPLKQIVFAQDCCLTSIGMECFNCSKIKNISIPKTVTSLGDNCFCNCRKLQTVVFAAESVLESIPKSCFKDCALVKVRIPQSIGILGEGAFDRCFSLREVEFAPDSKLREIQYGCFRGCPITNIRVDPIVDIYDEAFDDEHAVNRDSKANQ
jgi:hypothetical protein